MKPDARWNLIKDVFQAAIDRPADERRAFVDRACGGDEALRQEVQSLLDAHREAGRFVERSALEDLVSAQPGVEYQILSTLGAGGMGEVYRARDVALGRDVAIKILPPGLAADPSRLARFDREARLLASLNHPNICAIHGITDISGVPGLVLELVEGPTLRERLLDADRSGYRQNGRRLRMKEAFAIGRDIAQALEAAHDKGIIHRDLKPANVKITPDGMVKVLDFGLAKATAESLPPENSDIPIASAAAESQHGVLLGTAAYMSPEQARGEAVDKRSDIWSFGCVLYEMLTGRRAMPGATASEAVAAVLESEPDLIALPSGIPPNVRRLVQRCLEKDPRRRLKDIGDARLELEDALMGEAPAVRGGGNVRPGLTWLWVAAAVVVIGAAILMSRPREAVNAPQRRVNAELGTDALLVTFQLGQGSSLILSPDGEVLAFVAQASPGAPRSIYVRRLNQLAAVPLTGTDGALNPFFSPDGRRIGFFADGKLKVVPTAGGGAVTICSARANRGGAWGDDDLITFAPDRGGAPLWQVRAVEGSEPVPLIPLGDDEVTQRWPQMLPGGRAVLFTGNNQVDGFQDANVVVQSLPNGPRKVLVQGAYFGRYLVSGHLVYVRDSTVFAVPFNLGRLEIGGPAVPVLEGVTVNAPVGAAEIAFADDGTVAYLPAQAQVNYLDAAIDWLDRRGGVSPLRRTATRWLNLRFASDGRRLALAQFDGKQQDIWVYDWARDQATKLTIDPADDVTPVWTPDGSRIAFQSTRGGRASNLYWQRVDGAGEPQRLTNSPQSQTPGSWHPDGRTLAFTEVNASTGTSTIITLRLDGDETSGWKPAEPTLFLEEGAAPAFSPDGRWLLYTARSRSPSGTDVFVRRYPGPGGPWQISTEGGIDPVWSAKSREVFYGTPDHRIMVAEYSVAGGAFHVEKPRLIPNSQFTPRVAGRSFDVHPDGDRFALVKAAEDRPNRNHVTLIVNFFEELRTVAIAATKR